MEQRLAAQYVGQGDGRSNTMAKDDRDILELLKEELAFIEQGGYGRSVRTPWLPKSAFQDSLTCINYGYPYRAHPCTECHLLDFVADEHRSEQVPCHYIPLNEAGETIEDLENEVAKLEDENSELQDENEAMEREINDKEYYIKQLIRNIKEGKIIKLEDIIKKLGDMIDE
jgi:hypothetical protein